MGGRWSDGRGKEWKAHRTPVHPTGILRIRLPWIVQLVWMGGQRQPWQPQGGQRERFLITLGRNPLLISPERRDGMGRDGMGRDGMGWEIKRTGRKGFERRKMKREDGREMWIEKNGMNE